MTDAIEFSLNCNCIGKVSMKNESSDRAILPARLKPKKPNVFGYYIFKITSNLTSRWTYCRVIDWCDDENDCYLPTVYDTYFVNTDI